jgi:hypothetical protein
MATTRSRIAPAWPGRPAGQPARAVLPEIIGVDAARRTVWLSDGTKVLGDDLPEDLQGEGFWEALAADFLTDLMQ